MRCYESHAMEQGTGISVIHCSVENPDSCNDHYIMCDDPKDDFAALAPIAPRPKRRAESPLDHRVDRLRLPSLPIFLLVEPPLHLPPPPPGRRLLRRPASLRRDQGADAGGPDVLVDPLAVEVGVGQQRTDPRPAH